MNNKAQRITLFLTAIPILILVPIFLPYFEQLLMSLLILFLVIFASKEYTKMIGKLSFFTSKDTYYLVSLNGIFVALFYGMGYEITTYKHVVILAFIAILFFLSKPAFIPIETDKLHTMIIHSSLSILGMIYIGILGGFLVRIIHMGPIALVVFMLYVFLNDSNAYLTGMLWGKNNKGIVFISPNKSIAGFLGGFFSAIVVGTFVYFVFPDLTNYSYIKLMLISLLFSVVSNLGDLIESVLKRACGVKDSGTLIMGRGGILDSIDSLLIAAPVFYYFIGG